MASIGELRELIIAGGLMSYGPSLTAMFALAANPYIQIAVVPPARMKLRSTKEPEK